MAENKDPQAGAGKAPPPEAQAVKPPESPAANKQGPKAKFSAPVLRPREQMVFKIFLLAFTAFILDLVLIRPISDYLSRLDDSIRIEEEVIPKRLLILKYKNRIAGDYRDLKVLFVDPSVTQEEETAQFLREIERVSKETNFFVSNINPVKVSKKSENIYELSLEVEGKGGLKEIRNFMRMVEGANPSIRVGVLSLKSQGRQTDDLRALFSIVKIGVKKNHPSFLV